MLLCVLTFTSFAVASTSPTASAHHAGTTWNKGNSVNETIVLAMNNWTAYEVHLDARDRIQYRIRVISGSEVDLYMVPPTGLSQYQSDTAIVFTYYYSVERVMDIEGLFTGADGTVFFIVDNVDFSGAEPTGDVTVQFTLGREPSPPLPWVVLATCGIGFALAIAVGIALALRHRKKRLAAAAPPPLPPLPPPPPPPPP